MDDFVVFYAWQSDRQVRLNKHLIRIALNLAARNISNDANLGVRVRIDADTEGVLGHVPVTETILRKIMGCDAFVPDLTFVSKTKGRKLVCNPNVMLEYGYALRAKTHSLMMPVMNTAYGPAEKLPFDMGHLRHPIKYDLPEKAKNAERRAVRKALTEEFERILRLMIAARVRVETPDAPTFQEVARNSYHPALYFAPGQTLAGFGNPGEQEYRFVGEREIYLRLFPKYEQPAIGRVRLKEIVSSQRSLRAMSSRAILSDLAASNDFGYIVFDASSNSTTQAISQAFVSGEIWGLNSEVFSSAKLGHPEEKIIYFGAIGVEKAYTRALENFVSIVFEKMKLRSPYIVEIGAVGLRGIYMGAPHLEFGSHYYGPIREGSLVRRYELQGVTREERHDVLRQFFNDLYDLAEASRSDTLADEHIRKNDLPERS